MQTPAMSRCSSLLTSRRRLLKFPYPVSPSSNIGMVVMSLMNSRTSRTWVQDASLLSRTPSAAEMLNPLPQMPLNPASSAMRAERPLCASIMNSSSGDWSIERNCVVFLTGIIKYALDDLRTWGDVYWREMRNEVTPPAGSLLCFRWLYLMSPAILTTMPTHEIREPAADLGGQMAKQSPCRLSPSSRRASDR